MLWIPTIIYLFTLFCFDHFLTIFCQIIKNLMNNLSHRYRKTISRSAIKISTWWLFFMMLPNIWRQIFNNLTSPIFFNIAMFGPSAASTGPKSSCGPSSVLHEIDHIEQTNNYDISEKFPTPNFMMKTASLQKVEIFWEFDFIQHWSTKWLLAPTFGGPNFLATIFPENLQESLFRTPFVLTKHLLF